MDPAHPTQPVIIIKRGQGGRDVVSRYAVAADLGGTTVYRDSAGEDWYPDQIEDWSVLPTTPATA